MGLSYQLFPKRSTVVRGGFGVFYDLGYNFAGTALSANNYPYARTLSVPNVTLTAAAAAVQPPAIKTTPPYPRIFAYEPGFNTT